MDIFGVLNLVGGLALFLYGMDIMGKSLERQAGNRLQSILEKLTASPFKGLLLGLVTTAIIQSSSATTVMVIGFVNSGIMKLSQAIGVIMGANIGTTVTAWILSLSGISGSSLFVQLLKPTSFTPILAMVGIILYMFNRKDRAKNIGSTLLGFAILMFGMETMSGAVKPLADVPQFIQLFTLFTNPIVGVLVGAVLTAIIQSSSASVGILQALTMTGAVTYSGAIPIIMGQNIGTCITAMLSSIGANKNARRAALVHLYFNLIGVTLFLSLYLIVKAIIPLSFIDSPINAAGVALIHTSFNVFATLVMFPFTKQLERLACLTVRDDAQEESFTKLDERLLNTPSVAVDQSRRVAMEMAHTACEALLFSLDATQEYDAQKVARVLENENLLDRYEDMLGTYLVQLSALELPLADSREASMLLHMIGDFERIGDHAVNLSEVADEIHDKKLAFSKSAQSEIAVLIAAVRQVLTMAIQAADAEDIGLARRVEPLEQVIDDLTKELKTRHIERLQNGLCTIQLGFVLSDLLNNCERVADHSSNIAATLIEASTGSFEMHGYAEHIADSEEYRELYRSYRKTYTLENIPPAVKS